jgi:hypothetical protein
MWTERSIYREKSKSGYETISPDALGQTGWATPEEYQEGIYRGD